MTRRISKKTKSFTHLESEISQQHILVDTKLENGKKFNPDNVHSYQKMNSVFEDTIMGDAQDPSSKTGKSIQFSPLQ